MVNPVNHSANLTFAVATVAVATQQQKIDLGDSSVKFDNTDEVMRDKHIERKLAAAGHSLKIKDIMSVSVGEERAGSQQHSNERSLS